MTQSEGAILPYSAGVEISGNIGNISGDVIGGNVGIDLAELIANDLIDPAQRASLQSNAVIELARDLTMKDVASFQEAVTVLRTAVQDWLKCVGIVVSHEYISSGYAHANEDAFVDSVAEFVTQASLGRFAVPTLAAALKHPNQHCSCRAAKILGKIGPIAADAVPSLVASLYYDPNAYGLDDPDCDSNLEVCAAKALVEIGSIAVPSLICSLDKSIRWRVREILEQIGPAAVPALSLAVLDSNKDVQWNVVEVLKEIGPAAADSVPSLVKALKECSENDNMEFIVEALGEIGPAAAEAVPYLVAALQERSDDSDWEPIIDALGKIGPLAAEAVPFLLDALKSSRKHLRRSAALALGRVGAGAAHAAPALIANIVHWDDALREIAFEALINIGQPAEPYVTAAFKDKASDVSSQLVEVLGAICSPTLANVSLFLSALQNDDRCVRGEAARALGEMGSTAESAVPYLALTLHDPDRFVTWQAAQALGKIGPAAAGAIPMLVGTFAVPDDGELDIDLIFESVEALTRIGQACLPCIATHIKDHRSYGREFAVRVLSGIGEIAVDLLCETLNDSNQTLRHESAAALLKLGPASVPALCVTLKQRDPQFRARAARVLGEIGKDAIGARLSLATALKDSDVDVRRWSAIALREIGTGACTAVAELADALKDADKNVRNLASLALLAIGQPAAAAVPALAAALKDTDTAFRQTVAKVLAMIGPAAAAAVPALADAIVEDSDNYVRELVAETLGAIGPAASQAVPALVTCLANGRVGTCCAEAIVKIGAPAVPHLALALGNPKREVRLLVLETMGQIGVESNGITSALTEALADPDAAVRYFAKMTLDKIKSTGCVDD